MEKVNSHLKSILKETFQIISLSDADVDFFLQF